MNAKDTAQRVITLLEKEYPYFITALDWEGDWQLLVSVLLSAQTTDENVNRVTKGLFSALPSVEAIATAPIEKLEKLLFSTGYYRAKARNLKACCKKLLADFGGEVPATMEELITLPGVGRKTANVILHVLYHTASGIVMDTHISRVTQRLGFTKKKDPKQAEITMMKVLPKQHWRAWGDLLIQHGRKVCDARKPRCSDCVLNTFCPHGKKHL